MNYILLSDIMWYIGHIITGFAIYFYKRHSIAVMCVIVGQSLTMLSRPIGRIHFEPTSIQQYNYTTS
jgi:hypothetical protein